MLLEREERSMNARLRGITFVWAVPVLLGAVAAIAGSYYLPESTAAQAERQSNTVLAHFAATNLSFPASAVAFPAAKGADIANANCLICHSAGMVLRQPPLTEGEWRSEISKMKGSFGAPIPADQVDELAQYLASVNGRAAGALPGVVDGQGN
jgi:mono/diheme cytochrome c family protein